MRLRKEIQKVLRFQLSATPRGLHRTLAVGPFPSFLTFARSSDSQRLDGKAQLSARVCRPLPLVAPAEQLSITGKPAPLRPAPPVRAAARIVAVRLTDL